VKTCLDCFPCFLKQALECSRMHDSGNDGLHRKVLSRVMNILETAEVSDTPPLIARNVYSIIRDCVGKKDLYERVRYEDNRQMLEIYEEVKSLAGKGDFLYSACRLSAGFNIVDSGAGKRKTSHGIRDIRKILSTEPAVDDFNELREELSCAGRILIIGDNSGEIVMDRLFIEALKEEYPGLDIFYGVRGVPVINDVVFADAVQTGIDKICKVIPNGDSSPGTVLEFCSDEFNRCFNNADIIISKGQGNYETLSDSEKNIYFLLTVKCPVIARHTNIETGGLVIMKGRRNAQRYHNV